MSRGAFSASNRPLDTGKCTQSAGRRRYPAGCSDVWDLLLYTKIPHVTHVLLILQTSLSDFPPTLQISAQFILSMHIFSISQYSLRWSKFIRTIIHKNSVLHRIIEGSRAGGLSGSCHLQALLDASREHVAQTHGWFWFLSQIAAWSARVKCFLLCGAPLF